MPVSHWRRKQSVYGAYTGHRQSVCIMTPSSFQTGSGCKRKAVYHQHINRNVFKYIYELNLFIWIKVLGVHGYKMVLFLTKIPKIMYL